MGAEEAYFADAETHVWGGYRLDARDPEEWVLRGPNGGEVRRFGRTVPAGELERIAREHCAKVDAAVADAENRLGRPRLAPDVRLAVGQAVVLRGTAGMPLPALLEGVRARVEERVTYDGRPAYVVRPAGWGDGVLPVVFASQATSAGAREGGV